MKHLNGDRKQLTASLSGKGAHADFNTVLANFPVELRGTVPAGVPHSAWQLVEHMRMAQADILDFCVNPNYEELKWPDDYWPPIASPPDEAAWEKSLRDFHHDLKAMQNLVADGSRDLNAPIPHGEGQTLLREVLLVIDHNAYHIGQLVILRSLLGIWPPG